MYSSVIPRAQKSCIYVYSVVITSAYIVVDAAVL